MRGFLAAIRFLTRLPVPYARDAEAGLAASMRWFPMVGLMIGAIVAAGAALGGMVDSWTGAATGLVLWVAVTGALHLDGLGDVADATGAAHKDRKKMLAVMADPHVGSFAVVVIALQLLGKLILIHAAIANADYYALALVPCAARIGPLVWTHWLPSLHAGLAARFRGTTGAGDLAVWAAVLAGAGWYFPALLAAVPLIPLWGWWLNRRLGGISGDGHGAGIEIVETGLLLAISIAGKFA